MSFSSLYMSQTLKGANVIKYIPIYSAAEILLYVLQTLNSAKVIFIVRFTDAKRRQRN